MKYLTFIALLALVVIIVPSLKNPNYRKGDCFRYKYRDISAKITKVRMYRYEYTPIKPPLKTKIISKIQYIDNITDKIECPK